MRARFTDFNLLMAIDSSYKRCLSPISGVLKWTTSSISFVSTITMATVLLLYNSALKL